jgi:hypothetical protein
MNKLLQGAITALSLTFLATMPARSMPTEVPQDIIFVMDSSGSLGSAGYALQKAFMIDIVQNYGDDALHPTRFGVVEFSNGAFERYNFFQDQSTSAVTNAINSLSLLNSVTHTRTAIGTAIDMFVRDTINPGSPNPMTMVLITDGVPYPSQYNPCNAPSQKTELDANGIQTHIVGSGNFDPNQSSQLSCLVDDPATQISAITDFSDYSLFQQGYILNSMAMPAPGVAAIFIFAIAGIAATRRRA